MTRHPTAAPRAFQRLRQQVLTCHEALHAIRAVLGRHIGNVLHNPAARRAMPGGGMRQTWRG